MSLEQGTKTVLMVCKVFSDGGWDELPKSTSRKPCTVVPSLVENGVELCEGQHSPQLVAEHE
jgi:hypothetical protein